MAPLTQAQLAERGAAAVIDELQEQIDAIYKQYPALKTAATTAKRTATLKAKAKAEAKAAGGGAVGADKGPKVALSKDEIKAKREATMFARYGTIDLKEIAKIKKAQADQAVASGATGGAVNSETGAVAGQDDASGAIDVVDEVQAGQGAQEPQAQVG